MTKPGIYEHHKGGRYRVIGVAVSSTNSRAGHREVVYISLTTGRMHTREEREFHEVVTKRETFAGGSTVQHDCLRFRLVEEM